MRDLCASLEEKLSERGFDADDISISTEYTPTGSDLIVSKVIGGEHVCYKVHMDARAIPDKPARDKELEMMAIKTVEAFEDQLIDDIDLDTGHYHRLVRVCPYDGGWAECCVCDERVELSPVAGRIGFEKEAELATPAPMPRDMEEYTGRLDDGSRTLLKMYLLGMLRESCDLDCPNSKYYDGRWG